jgi:hypothetical protein
MTEAYMKVEYKPAFCSECRCPMEAMVIGSHYQQEYCAMCSGMFMAAAENRYMVRLANEYHLEMQQKKKLFPGGEYFG